MKEKICVICGSKFMPNSSRQKYCNKPVERICPICGLSYEVRCNPAQNHTCDKPECKNEYTHRTQIAFYLNTTRICAECGKEFHPKNNTQKYCEDRHFRTCVVCGNSFEVDVSKQHIPETCSKECHYKYTFMNGNPFSRSESRDKARKTMLERYGADHPMRSSKIVSDMYARYKRNTGYSHPSHDPRVRSKAASSAKHSTFEDRVCKLLEEYKIEYVRHYMLNSSEASHEFDIYIPTYKILIDCDGAYYHSYLEDPDGRHVLDYYDEDRLSLIPDDHIFHVIVEGQEEKDIKYIVDIIRKKDNQVFNYEGELFNWCRSIDFPYPNYPETRLRHDYASLCKYYNDKYVPSAMLGISIINQFHRSIYDAQVDGYVSPFNAWYDDNLLKKIILNRLIYKNEVDPFKIMRGFNISKVCPRVSVFNPVLAKYLITKYLSEFSEIADPFSGFSGRMLGAASLGKHYVGSDLNTPAVAESNKIINFLNLQNCSITQADILNVSSTQKHECVFTCPPYGKKEHYGDETVYQSCDRWIDTVIEKYKCNRYVFVVDNTDKYKQNIVEDIRSTSHLNKVVEHVVVVG